LRILFFLPWAEYFLRNLFFAVCLANFALLKRE